MKANGSQTSVGAISLINLLRNQTTIATIIFQLVRSVEITRPPARNKMSKGDKQQLNNMLQINWKKLKRT